MEAQTLPDSIAEYKAGIEDRDLCVLLRQESPVEPDLEAGVARIRCEVLASRHGFPLVCPLIPQRSLAASLSTAKAVQPLGPGGRGNCVPSAAFLTIIRLDFRVEGVRCTV